MCNELEQVGLKDPVLSYKCVLYCRRLFYNSKVGKTIVEKNRRFI